MSASNTGVSEDEYDLRIFEECEAQKAAGTLKTHPISEFWDELDLQQAQQEEMKKQAKTTEQTKQTG